MAGRKIAVSELGGAAVAEIRQRLARDASGLGDVLVDQALERIDQGGDSEHRYPEMWATRTGMGYRAGGEPLSDTGSLKGSLFGVVEVDGLTIKIGLRSNVEYALHHQVGFSTDGPNFIPLTQRARRDHRTGVDPETEGLVEGEDYVIAWAGVTVPQRKIFNMPPENARDIAEAVRVAIARG